LLLGASLLFWGAMTDRPLVGLVLALVVEACHWTRLRWEFNDAACVRAWHLSAVAIALTTMLIWLDGNRYTALPRLLGWLPPLLLPMQFVQAFGMRDSIPLNTFSFFARQRRARNVDLGLGESPIRMNFGNMYLVTVMVSSTLGARSNGWLFLPGLLILTAWALIPMKVGRPAHLLLGLLMAGLIAVAGRYGLAKAYEWVMKGGLEGSDSFLDPNHYRTAIGRLGEIKLSPTILWRIRTEQGTMPPLHLRTASYDRYSSGIWSNSERSVSGQAVQAEPSGLAGKSQGLQAEKDFVDLVSRDRVEGESYWLLRANAGEEAFSTKLPRFSIRGAAETDMPIPLPGDAASLRDFQLDGVERNSLGTVRIFPKESVIDGLVLWRDQGNPEFGPDEALDLKVSERERALIRRYVRQLGLDRLPDLKSKLDLLSGWFAREFEYSLYLSISQPGFESSGKPTAIGTFLDTTRKGHCEYFATAASMLLRESGVPTRYAIGYVVVERDDRRQEYVVRGVHGHAWCRVWDDAKRQWVDFDPTPPGWLAMETRATTWTQDFHDWLQRVREDFFIWRGRAENRLAVTLVLLGFSVGGLIFILRRLWRSRRKVDSVRSRMEWIGERPVTALHSLEPLAAAHLGIRAQGVPFSRWLAELMPVLPEPVLLDEAIRIHQRLRYDPEPAPSQAVERLNELVKRLKLMLDHLGKPRSTDGSGAGSL
jgi:transglutaminase-like putative cysteine protease